MDKRPVAVADPLQGRAAPQDFVLARVASRGSFETFSPAALARAAKRSAEASIDAEILAWIASHVPANKQRKPTLS